ncbi:MAG: ribose-5-phosphate isomerase A [Rhodomicrobium sp.]|nr:MAG: ribose-5-phosphate isomerase A [Rhodomicrobium sp.]
MSAEEYKLAAARAAVELIENGMKVGLGTGSTAALFINLLGERVNDGLDVVCVPTSKVSEIQAANLGITLTTLDEEPFLDITVDGADELDRHLRLIKGGGGALLREKIVAMSSDRMVVIADHTKLVQQLGAFPLPVEVDKFGVRSTLEMIAALTEELGLKQELQIRETSEGTFYQTDGGNYIVDCQFDEITDPEELSDCLAMLPGVVDNGLFIGIAERAFIGGPDGVEVLEADYGEYEV